MVLSLVGLPGSGKSTVARTLSSALDTDWVDTDHLIEVRIGMPIRAFFEQQGEEAFRDVEQAVVADALSRQPSVLATGGGAVLRAANRQQLKAHSCVVYLQASPEDLYRRLRLDKKRPLLQTADPLARLRELHGVRHPLYCQVAHGSVDTGKLNAAAAVRAILNLPVVVQMLSLGARG